MSQRPAPVTPSSPTTQRPQPSLLSLFGVFVPIPLAMLAAQWLEVDAVGLAGIGVSLALASWMQWSRGGSWADLGLRGDVSRGRLLLTVLAAVGVLLVVNVLLGRLLAALGLSPDLSRFAFLRGNLPGLLLTLVVVWTVAAFGEEMLFRGVLMNALADLLRLRAGDRIAWALALVVTSVVVGAGHAYYGPAGVIITGVLGAGFGLVYLVARRNLWAPILTHGLFDTVAFVVLYVTLNRSEPVSSLWDNPGAGLCVLFSPGVAIIA
ncbi:MAG TPA: type II CAAX endopeptidase family protein [Gemmataceae bacterium]|nr:type II CAAX endopeptidase family protein [Gemmataceae bacterium]